MMKLIRLGYKITHYLNDQDQLMVLIVDPKEFPTHRVACDNVTTLPTFAAVESIEIVCQEYMKRNGL